MTSVSRKDCASLARKRNITHKIALTNRVSPPPPDPLLPTSQSALEGKRLAKQMPPAMRKNNQPQPNAPSIPKLLPPQVMEEVREMKKKTPPPTAKPNSPVLRYKAKLVRSKIEQILQDLSINKRSDIAESIAQNF
jgi:hypothetical protein